MYVNCPLAKWTHKKGFDSRPSMSVKVNETGHSPAFCWNPECAFKGSLKRLVYTLTEYDNSVYLELFLNLFNDYERYDYTKFIDDFDISFDNIFEGSREHVYDKSMLLRYPKVNKPWRCISQKAVKDLTNGESAITIKMGKTKKLQKRIVTILSEEISRSSA